MRQTNLRYLLLALLIMGVTLGLAFSEKRDSNATSHSSTNTTETENNDQSSEAFDKMMAVLRHKRCVNCHPAGVLQR